MANNVPVTPGSGTTVATDEVVDATLGTVQVQYIKLMDGTNDGTNRAVVGASGGLAVRGAAVAGTSGSIAAAGTGTIGPVNVAEAGNVTFIVKNTTAASAFAGSPVIVFEQSDDGVSWGPLNVVRASDTAVASVFTVSSVGANGSLCFDGAVEGVNSVRARVTTGPTTNPMTVVITCGGMPFTPALAVVPRRDANRTPVSYFMVVPIVTTATDVLMSLTGWRAGVAVAATTTPAVVPAGRTLRLTHGTLTYLSIATAGLVRMNLRANPAGVVAVGSPPVTAWMVGTPAAAAGVSSALSLEFPDGMEFAAGTGIGVTQIGLNATGTASAVGYGQITLYGFEY